MCWSNRQKKKMHRRWKQNRVPGEEYTSTVQMCRDGMRKAKTEINFTRDANNNKKRFCRYIGHKRKTKVSSASDK